MPSTSRLVDYSSSDSEETVTYSAAPSGLSHTSADVHSTLTGHPLYTTSRTAGQPSGYTPMSQPSGIHRDYRRSPEQSPPNLLPRQPSSSSSSSSSYSQRASGQLPYSPTMGYLQERAPLAPSIRPTAEEEHHLFTVPHLPPAAMSYRDLNYSQLLLFPPPAALRTDGQIMRAWQSSNIADEFRKNNNLLKASNGTICRLGREALNISPSYWHWLTHGDAPPHAGGHLTRRAVLCDEQHNRHAHSLDGAYFECPFEHRLVDFPRWTHTYPHLVCRSCEDAQPDFCAPLVRQMLTDGPLVAMCERCAIDALQRFGPGHNGCRCSRGAFGGMCLVHQNQEAESIARGWLTYRRLHHGPGGADEHGNPVQIPYCKCNRLPVPRSRRPFAFWCAACEEAVVLPDDEDGWASGNGHAQRWLRLDNLPEADFDAPWVTYPSEAPPRRQVEPPVNPDLFRPSASHQRVVLGRQQQQPPPPPSTRNQGASMTLPTRTPPLAHALPAATTDAFTQTSSSSPARHPPVVPNAAPQFSVPTTSGPALPSHESTTRGAIKRHRPQQSSSSIDSEDSSSPEQRPPQTQAQHRNKLPRTTTPPGLPRSGPTTTTPPGMPKRMTQTQATTPPGLPRNMTSTTTTPPGLPRSLPGTHAFWIENDDDDETEEDGEEEGDGGSSDKGWAL